MNVFGYSAEFSINLGSGTIRITSPTSDTKWKPGETVQITWTSTGTITDVDIDIFKEDTLLYYTVDEYPDLGVVTWIIPSDIEQGTNWKVSITNSDNSAQSDTTDAFSIKNPDPNYLPLTIGIIVGAVGVAALGLVIRSRFKKRRSRDIVQKIGSESRDIPQHTLKKEREQSPSKPSIEKSIKFCMDCGHPNKKEVAFCEECGTKLPY